MKIRPARAQQFHAYGNRDTQTCS